MCLEMTRRPLPPLRRPPLPLSGNNLSSSPTLRAVGLEPQTRGGQLIVRPSTTPHHPLRQPADRLLAKSSHSLAQESWSPIINFRKFFVRLSSGRLDCCSRRPWKKGVITIIHFLYKCLLLYVPSFVRHCCDVVGELPRQSGIVRP